MSKYAEFPTTITDGGHLAAALKAMGFEIECHNEPQTLMDYCRRPRSEKATIIIRRNHTGINASNDIGFVKGPDGAYKAIISEYDQSVKFGASWMGELKQSYTEIRTLAMAKRKGYILQSKTKTSDGAVHLLFQAR